MTTPATTSAAMSHASSRPRMESTATGGSCCASLIRLGERVAQSADIANRVGAELAAQMMNMHFDCVALHFFSPSVETLLELSARQDRSGPLQQRGEQRIFPSRQRHRLAFPRRLSRGRVQCELAVLEQWRGAPAMTPQYRTHAGSELFEIE